MPDVESCPECHSLAVAYFYGRVTISDVLFVKVSSHGTGAARKEDLETECITDYSALKVEHGDKGSVESLNLASRWLRDQAMDPFQMY